MAKSISKRGNYEARNSQGKLLTSGSTIESVENESCFNNGYVYDRKGDRFFVAGRYPVNRHNWTEGRFLPVYLRNKNMRIREKRNGVIHEVLQEAKQGYIVRGGESERIIPKRHAEVLTGDPKKV